MQKAFSVRGVFKEKRKHMRIEISEEKKVGKEVRALELVAGSLVNLENNFRTLAFFYCKS